MKKENCREEEATAVESTPKKAVKTKKSTSRQKAGERGAAKKKRSSKVKYYEEDDDEDEEPEYVTDPELIDEKWGDRVDLVFDGGMGGTELSTVVDCTDGDATILRQGLGWLDF